MDYVGPLNLKSESLVGSCVVGRWWERRGRTLKELLRRVLGKPTVDYEELNTILCDCESGINARPLTYIQDDPCESVPLTPGLFIHGGRNNETPDLDHVDQSALIKRTIYITYRKLRENLRQKFRNNYFALLVYKGVRRNDALNVGDILLIRHDQVRRIDWPLGIILEIYSGKKGVPRVARVRTYKGERICPFQRLYTSEVSAKADVDVLKASRQSEISVRIIPDSSVDCTDTFEMRHPPKSRGRTIRIPHRMDL
ncbi:uncharacterized protein LOC118183097 [Stegodyphus dumicola]|uniref:uncharacterized protein LOC118183097 n=1 Tax=Stegodyphus dumicola TaxID=202533 RepID=UPI0015A7B47F|nr:uncharacterized protein LOC118183097 [Stegodyphus dumicola]